MVSEVMSELTRRKRPSFQQRWFGSINVQSVEAHGLDGKTELTPVFETTRQWAHSPDAGSPQLQCRTGTRGFVRSSAVQDDLMLWGDLVRA